MESAWQTTEDRQRRTYGAALSLGLTAVALYILLWPWLLHRCWPGGAIVRGGTAATWWQFYLAETLACSWVFAFGSVIGSYLNVVIYRSPRGMSLLGGSRCPRCEQAIRPSDNVPVLGWLLLRGRCRTCRLPISARYPLVELIVGTTFLLIAQLEIFTGGVNLPGAAKPALVGAMWNLLDPNWPAIGIGLFHLWLLVSLFCWAMIHFDRAQCADDSLRVPRRYYIYTATIGALPPLAWPWLRPLDWQGATTSDAAGPIAAVLTPLIGMLLGLLAGLAIAVRYWRPNQQDAQFAITWRGSVAAYLAVGLFLGWQAVLAVYFVENLASLLVEIRHRAARHTLTHVGLATAGSTLLAVLTWRWWWHLIVG